MASRSRRMAERKERPFLKRSDSGLDSKLKTRKLLFVAFLHYVIPCLQVVDRWMARRQLLGKLVTALSGFSVI